MSNADTLRRIFSLMDEHDFASIRELLATEFSAIFGGNPPMGVEEWAGMSQMFYAAFPGGKHTIHEIFEVDDHVFHRGSFSGTHTGDFMGMPPTGKEITITEMTLDRFVDGKLLEHRAEADMAGLMQQLGASSNVAAHET
ncbi:MAG: ester cyclase [Gaiellaceae bacterium]